MCKCMALEFVCLGGVRVWYGTVWYCKYSMYMGGHTRHGVMKDLGKGHTSFCSAWACVHKLEDI